MRMVIVSDQDRQRFCQLLNAIELGKRKFIAEFKVYRLVRSLKQNKLYFKWLQCIKDETGNDVDTLHDYFKGKYLVGELVNIFGQERKKHVSTTNLDTKQFSEYLEHIKQEMLQEGIYLPSPGEQGWDEFYARYGI
jgi:hypothetical protein